MSTRRVPSLTQVTGAAGRGRISGLIYEHRARSRMPYQLINSATGRVQRASRSQLMTIHRMAKAASKKRAACAFM